ncbi:MAG: alpha/beta fold hydrolase [Lachnospiraceae bacterium]|nr:alpha/beta fold hydrolase [Lachnospiraceae bacterium]
MIFLILFAILCLLTLSAAFLIFRLTLYSPNKSQNDDHTLYDSDQIRPYRAKVLTMIDELNAIPFETHTIRSFDGLTLYGRYYHQTDGAPLAICFHGYRGTPSRDFSGGIRIYREQGFNILMAEQRGHKRSEGHRITLGVKERQDCLDWVRYAAAHFGENTPIVLGGISMGAATVLMASALDLPGNVKGIIADCPFTSPKEIMLKVAGGMGFPRGPVYPFIWLAARLFGGFSPTAADSREAVKAAKIPILLIHGEADHFVPCGMSREIAAAAPEKIAFHTFPDAGHGLSFLTDPQRYQQIVTDFLDRVLTFADHEP